jgi:hypothetical protein
MMHILPISVFSAARPKPSTPAATKPAPVPAEDDDTSETPPSEPAAGGSAAGSLSVSSTIVYDLDNVAIEAPTIDTSSGVRVDASIYIIDMEGHSAAQIAEYRGG